MGLLAVLTIIFIVLKAVGVIAWSWWLVLSPLLAEVVISGLLIGFIGRKGYKVYKKNKR
jgi:hypothetical protein